MSKEKMITKVMKYRIVYNKELYNILRDIQHSCWKMRNKAQTMNWDWQKFSSSYKERHEKSIKDKDELGVTLVADINRYIKDVNLDISSHFASTVSREVTTDFKNKLPEVLKGELAVTDYKRKSAFTIKSQQIKNIEKIDTKTYGAKLSLLSKECVAKNKEKVSNGEDVKIGLSTQVPVKLMSGKGANEIIDRIISGEYKLGDSKITQHRKGRFYLSVTYSFIPDKQVGFLNKEKVMGIDVGVNVPAYLAIDGDNYYRMEVGNSEEIIGFRKQMEARKRKLASARKWAGEGSKGHGRKTLMKPVDRLGDKIKNYREHKNHVWSRFIVDEALKNNCGTIQMENLSGISSDSVFLKNWTYYDLQTKIANKAKEYGIEVVKVKPAYTSSRCNKCGYVHVNEDKKDWRPTQDQFKCTRCDWGHKLFVNADWNAAKNIAIPHIDSIIKAQIEAQEEYEKKMEKLSKSVEQ